MNIFKSSKNVLPHLFSYIKLKFNSWYLDDLINSEPDSNSLVGIVNILDNYKVDNLPVKLSFDEVEKLDLPFVTQLINSKDEVIFVTHNADGKIKYVNDRGKDKTIYADEFSKLWVGIILMIEKTEQSKEPNYQSNTLKDYFYRARIPFTIISFITILIYSFIQNLKSVDVNFFLAVTLFGLTFIGLLVTILLLIQSVDKNNLFVSKFCSILTKNGCDTILQKDASKLWGLISWSEIGFVFFAGYLFNVSFVLKSFPLMFMLTICCIPFTFWSVYYQAKIAKSMCMLCNTVLILIWLIFITHTLFGTPLEFVNGNTFLLSIFCFLIPSVVLYFFIPYINKSMQVKPLKHKLHNLLANKSIFEASLEIQQDFYINNAAKKITFGNPEAKFTISVVTNPFCEPCSRTHVQLEKLLALYRDEIAIRIIFIPSNNDNERNLAIKHLMAIYLQKGALQAEKAYNYWYNSSKNDIKQFISCFPADPNDPAVIELFESHREWCETENIQFTPTVIINNHKLPEWYSIKDLRYLIKY